MAGVSALRSGLEVAVLAAGLRRSSASASVASPRWPSAWISADMGGRDAPPVPRSRWLPPLSALPPGQPRALRAEGDITVIHEGPRARCDADSAWHGAGACVVTGGEARVRRCCAGIWFPRQRARRRRACSSTPMDLDPAAAWLMRCDRVDFEPGGVALPHRHRGGGIRCLRRRRAGGDGGRCGPAAGASRRRLVRERPRARRWPALAPASPRASSACRSCRPRSVARARSCTSIPTTPPRPAAALHGLGGRADHPRMSGRERAPCLDGDAARPRRPRRRPRLGSALPRRERGRGLGGARAFPWGTLAVNLVGSFLIGLVQRWQSRACDLGRKPVSSSRPA